MGLDAIFKLITGRAIPAPLVDSTEGRPRGSRYGEAGVLSYVRKSHLLADEGSYYVTNNAQTGIASAVGTSFSATAGFIVVQNTDSTDNANCRRIYMDYVNLTTTAAGSWASAGVNTQIMVYLSTSARYSSGGTNLTANITSPNSSASKDSIAQVYVGAITTTAAAASDRPICGLRILRPAVSATVVDVIGETKHLNFGGVEGTFSTITVANANQVALPLPPVIIGPGHSMVIHYIMNGTTPGAASYAPEIAWWER